MSDPTVVLEVDGLAEAAYVRFSNLDVTRTVTFSDEINIDLDTYGMVVGIEVLDLAAEIPFAALTTDYHVESQKIELLRILRPSVAGFVSQSQLEISTSAPSQSIICVTRSG